MTKPQDIFLGHVSPSQADYEQVVMAFRAKVYERARDLVPSRYPSMARGETKAVAAIVLGLMMRDQETAAYSVPAVPRKQMTQEEFFERHGILSYLDYRQAVKEQNKLRQHRALDRFPENPETTRFINLPQDEDRYKPNLAGWLAYLVDIEPKFGERLLNFQKPGIFPAANRKNHTYIAAPNGWGKSELMKALAFHDIQHPTGSLVIVDPHGDMVDQIARFPELAVGDRLVLLQPELRPDHYFCINPLEAPGLNENQKAAYAETLAAALSLIAGSVLTPNMVLVATACLRVLLDRPGSTLIDLRNMLLEPEPPSRKQQGPVQAHPRDPLLQLARNHHDPEVAHFFRYEFDKGTLKGSKSGLADRLTGLVMLPGFRAMTCGPSTFNLEALIESRKVVLFNLKLIGKTAKYAFGRMLLALLEDIGERRVRQALEGRVPVQVIVDEASMIVSPTMLAIINNLRKFGVHLTLAQQTVGAKFDAEGRSILASVGCRIVGSNSPREHAELFEHEARGLPQIGKQEFLVKWGTAAPVVLRVRSDLIDKTHAVTEAMFERTIREQLRYYRLHSGVRASEDDGLPGLMPAGDVASAGGANQPASLRPDTGPKPTPSPPNDWEALAVD